MGLAASQARFLGLTARKSNVEYEGQQINQQRTTLANQTANYYNDLLGMAVPVPPSVDDYTKTVYTFTDGALTNEITAMIAKDDGNYTISYLRQWVDDFSVVNASTSIVNGGTSGPWKVGSSSLRTMQNYTDDQIAALSSADLTTIRGDSEYLETLSDDELKNLLREEREYIYLLQNKYGTDDYLVRYVKNTTTEEWNPYFYKKNHLTGAIYDGNGNSQSNVDCYKIGSEVKTDEVKAIPNCKVEKDSSGRYINITIPIYDAAGNQAGQTTYALTTETITDQAKYDDAMNQYEYDKYQYDQTIQEINAKIEIIQAEDRNLELRLKQLDTEQEAIQTEMDSVSGVIQKNTESSFKTFG